MQLFSRARTALGKPRCLQRLEPARRVQREMAVFAISADEKRRAVAAGSVVQVQDLELLKETLEAGR